MGKGNVQKAAQKREKNQKKLDAQSKAGSVKDSFNKNLTQQCAFCKQQFLGNVNRVKLEEHAQTHEKVKKTFADCFPSLAEQPEE
ncbi:hypothetical protein AKO1_014191 [Acrasis kona]|uniref:At2g23090-like zinc-binding domain-containing protein n=1 Tax=Acrasis kona TaxID=1008807 RepID=A0AAW2Z1E2_9EUKA